MASASGEVSCGVFCVANGPRFIRAPKNRAALNARVGSRSRLPGGILGHSALLPPGRRSYLYTALQPSGSGLQFFNLGELTMEFVASIEDLPSRNGAKFSG